MIDANELSWRIAGLRAELTGPRGKSTFAKKLGISPSTYDYYESGRVPPAEVLVKIADLAEVDLRWLISGESGGASVSAGHPVVQRVAKLLDRNPDAAEPLAAFLDILAGTMEFPAKPAAGQAAAAAPEPPAEPATARASESPASPARPADGLADSDARRQAAEPVQPSAERPASDASSRPDEWIPVLGRSAAGVAQFWAPGEGRGVTELRDLAARRAAKAPRRVTPAVAAEPTGREPRTVQLVTLAGPDDEGVSEFVSAGDLARRCPDAFAVRIDGESMSPDIAHGDLVVASPSAPAVDARAALVQLDGQIGVTCKLYRREGDTVHLVPVNERFAPQSYPADSVVWALRVLARIRMG